MHDDFCSVRQGLQNASDIDRGHSDATSLEIQRRLRDMIWHSDRLVGDRKLAMLRIAEAAFDEGGEIIASVSLDDIATATTRDRTGARRLINRLVNQGILERVRHDGWSCTYRFILGLETTSNREQNVQVNARDARRHPAYRVRCAPGDGLINALCGELSDCAHE